jgi:AICAR transformylase/IMP cyclohydrolase PurH
MTEISYTRCGDYLLPNITLREPPKEQTEQITRYGAMRRSFLKTHRPILYSELLLSEQLFSHLREIQQTAQARLDSIMSNILTFQPPPDKAADGLAWAAHMSEIHRSAEKMMLDEIVYT